MPGELMIAWLIFILLFLDLTWTVENNDNENYIGNTFDDTCTVILYLVGKDSFHL